MNNLNNLKTAIVADWIKDMWWAELVLQHMLELFPNADIFTSVFFQENNKIFKWRNIITSFIQKIPFINKSHKLALTLRPLAFESFDLSSYDLVISSTSAESKWVITKPNCLHICYCHTPTRYFWSHYHEYKNMLEFWLLNIFAKYLMPKIIHKLRLWDFSAAQRPDIFIANSQNTKNRIKKYYKRESDVIYPWIETDDFYVWKNRKNYYIYIWRCIPYKKFDLLVDTFNKNWKEIILCTNTENKLYKNLKNKSKKNITWKLNLERKEIAKLLSEAKAFIFPAEEDFWLVPIEAMSSGTPVIAYRKWWVIESVIEWKTWIFFNNQDENSINTAIKKIWTSKFWS